MEVSESEQDQEPLKCFMALKLIAGGAVNSRSVWEGRGEECSTDGEYLCIFRASPSFLYEAKAQN